MRLNQIKLSKSLLLGIEGEKYFQSVDALNQFVPFLTIYEPKLSPQKMPIAVPKRNFIVNLHIKQNI
jgi:hypothetical protein